MEKSEELIENFDDKDELAESDLVIVAESFAGKSHVPDLEFIEAVKKIGVVLLQKSQTPTIKQQKKSAVEQLVSNFKQKHKVVYTDGQIYKRLQNIKQRVKTKTDAKRSGNERIILSKAEQILFDLMTQQDNPTIPKVKGKIFFI